MENPIDSTSLTKSSETKVDAIASNIETNKEKISSLKGTRKKAVITSIFSAAACVASAVLAGFQAVNPDAGFIVSCLAAATTVISARFAGELSERISDLKSKVNDSQNYVNYRHFSRNTNQTEEK